MPPQLLPELNLFVAQEGFKNDSHVKDFAYYIIPLGAAPSRTDFVLIITRYFLKQSLMHESKDKKLGRFEKKEGLLLGYRKKGAAITTTFTLL